MTKGDLIVACLKLMYENNDEQLDVEEISSQDEYKSKTVNIIESINRALSEIAKADKLPVLIKEIDAFYYGVTYTTSNTVPSEKVGDYDYVRVANDMYKWSSDESSYLKQSLPVYFQLSQDTDIFKILGITWEVNNEYVYKSVDAPVRYKGNSILLLRHNEGSYIINYTPKFKRLSYDDEDTDVITLADSDETPIPDYILDIVPYFVKGDLYEEDEPQMAVLATNKFHQYLEELVNPYQRQTQTRVDSRYNVYDV